ncbi:MAG: helix-turn-helix transcriptional regulator [Pegethrix bostrychoides GSE-TBD4-15B]|jgi:DNA-binding Xre family transcriptional regulator|uniref:Helix-turn-helix transcriptional regulator n=1 Tax=Pegethrix bostrychoides GSE-TBD4-15B TaxID=2839662 RepID=A0A951PAH2_9CYAN|nr:helix-turn-helix transcriptional regulator [Pegethrix bostrychoides GSE-TBD4-15B]
MKRNRNESAFMNFLRQKNKTPEDVAAALEISPRAVYYWTSGTREPRLTVRQIQALCRLLDCSVFDLPPDFGMVDS